MAGKQYSDTSVLLLGTIVSIKWLSEQVVPFGNVASAGETSLKDVFYTTTTKKDCILRYYFAHLQSKNFNLEAILLWTRSRTANDNLSRLQQQA